ncbi:glycogen synthase [Striga asiatica]|uniref:Glycogen synthase n=1 Tax=Striga asiatica TaxID=4170 RepID=A0A5A7PEV2_STRAF|nr:glycogen synthase [Striga asiatica]
MAPHTAHTRSDPPQPAQLPLLDPPSPRPSRLAKTQGLCSVLADVPVHVLAMLVLSSETEAAGGALSREISVKGGYRGLVTDLESVLIEIHPNRRRPCSVLQIYGNWHWPEIRKLRCASGVTQKLISANLISKSIVCAKLTSDLHMRGNRGKRGHNLRDSKVLLKLMTRRLELRELMSCRWDYTSNPYLGKASAGQLSKSFWFLVEDGLRSHLNGSEPEKSRTPE